MLAPAYLQQQKQQQHLPSSQPVNPVGSTPRAQSRFLWDHPFDTSALYREAMDAHGQVTQERAQAGKGWVLDRSYEQHTGRLTGILARAGTRSLSEGTLQHHLYGYDDLGNVTWREANLGPGHAFREDFSYDALQRLTGSQVLVQGIPSSESISYDSTGNITWRSGKGGYLYSRSHDSSCASSVAPGPHAVTAVDGMVLCYDANGNALRRGATQFVYDASNRVRTARDALAERGL